MGRSDGLDGSESECVDGRILVADAFTCRWDSTYTTSSRWVPGNGLYADWLRVYTKPSLLACDH